jgi:hypothetical protein
VSSSSKQNISGIICVLSAAFAVFCIARMIPYGLAGEAGKVKLYFFLMLPGLLISLPFGVAYYYSRSRASSADEDLEHMRIEVGALSHTAARDTEKAQKQDTPK